MASDSELQIEKDGKPVTVLSTETMVLRRETSSWRIVRIHGHRDLYVPGR